MPLGCMSGDAIVAIVLIVVVFGGCFSLIAMMIRAGL